MSKITRQTQKIFGSSAGLNQIGKFGSFAAGSPAYPVSAPYIAEIQSLSNYLTGWFGAILGANSPAIEDMNAVCYLFAYQLAYIMQAGISEWDTNTTYYIGSVVSDGAGRFYRSIQDANLGNAVTNVSYWANMNSGNIVSAAGPTAYTMTGADTGKTFFITTSSAAITFNLPAPVLNYEFKFVDISGNCSINNITLHRNASESIQGVASDYALQSNGGSWKLVSDGANWYLV